MERNTKTKQIAVRFDHLSYDKIRDFAEAEHRGIGEFVRHTTLFYMEHFDRLNKSREHKNSDEGTRLHIA